MEQSQEVLAQRPPAWIKRCGVGGFVFFLIKGLLWLTVPAFLAIAGLE
jgi:hypothetical protein